MSLELLKERRRGWEVNDNGKFNKFDKRPELTNRRHKPPRSLTNHKKCKPKDIHTKTQ